MTTINNRLLLNSLKCTITRLFSAHTSKSNLRNILLTMPRSNTHVDTMRRHRIKLKEKGKKYLPGILNLQVLGSGAKGSPRALYLFTDQTRYLFNCSEGTQRLALEHKCKLSKLEHIFITNPKWENMGGLPGMALSAQDVGVPHFTLHGPSGTNEIFQATERFVILRSLSVSMFDCDSDTMYEDDVMVVRYARLIKKASDNEESNSDHSIESTEDDTDYYAHEINLNGKRRKLTDETVPKYKKTESSGAAKKRITEAMAYICKLKPRHGSLCFEKCVEKGVTPGPLFGMLKDGEDITLPNGNVVRSSDVRMPDDPGAVFIVLECPTLDHLDSLVENPVFENYQHSVATDENLAFCVVHFTPEEVMADPRYRDWMDKFGISTKHLVLNEENDCLGSEAVHRMQHKLHLIHPKIFPFLNEQGFHKVHKKLPLNIVEGKEDELVEDLMGNSNQSESTKTAESSGNSVILRAKTLQSIHLRPRRGFDRSSELKLQPEEYLNEAMADDRFLDVLAELQTEINSKMKEIGDIAEYPKLIFLGTGSCAPNKNRNTSGILLRISETSSIILDCGEGTLTQIMRFYNKTEAHKVLASIKAIYVSHLHADHHMGLIGLLKARQWVTKDPAFVLAPKQISSWLSFYHKRFEPILDKLTLVHNDDLKLGEHNNASSEKQTRIYTALGAKDISTVRVKHVPNSFGIAITLENGYKVTYSGDTMPCNDLVELGNNSDLLIHEATMEDELENEAKLKLHSTTLQAIDVGKKMNAKFTLLTHFSQRYAKLPRLPDELAQTVGIAFDNMEVRIGELTILPLLYPALRIMFAEACEELDLRAAKRKLRLQYS